MGLGLRPWKNEMRVHVEPKSPVTIMGEYSEGPAVDIGLDGLDIYSAEPDH